MKTALGVESMDEVMRLIVQMDDEIMDEEQPTSMMTDEDITNLCSGIDFDEPLQFSHVQPKSPRVVTPMEESIPILQPFTSEQGKKN